LFAEMQQAILARTAEILPRVQVEAVEKEEAVLKEERLAAQQSGGAPTGAAATRARAQEPRTSSKTYGRNDLVTIAKDNQVQEVKYKKAEPLLAEGWKIVG
jgi:hypothetical protein